MGSKMDYRSKILAHLRKNWGAEARIETLRVGPLHELPNNFGVVVFNKSAKRDMHTYATVCMSQPEDKSPVELFLFSPLESEGLTELLTAVAHFHRTGHHLGLGHTVNFGRSWLPRSRCSYGYVSLPYLDGPDLEWLGGSPSTRFLWLIPITEEERAFKMKFGTEALEKCFDDVQFNYLLPERKSVCP